MKGPAGATTSVFPEGLYEVSGTYDFTSIDSTGVLELGLAKAIYTRKGFGTISHRVSHDNRKGCFRLQGYFSDIELEASPG